MCNILVARIVDGLIVDGLGKMLFQAPSVFPNWPSWEDFNITMGYTNWLLDELILSLIFILLLWEGFLFYIQHQYTGYGPSQSPTLPPKTKTIIIWMGFTYISTATSILLFLWNQIISSSNNSSMLRIIHIDKHDRKICTSLATLSVCVRTLWLCMCGSPIRITASHCLWIYGYGWGVEKMKSVSPWDDSGWLL